MIIIKLHNLGNCIFTLTISAANHRVLLMHRIVSFQFAFSFKQVVMDSSEADQPPAEPIIKDQDVNALDEDVDTHDNNVDAPSAPSAHLTTLVEEIKEHYGLERPTFTTLDYNKKYHEGDVKSLVLASEDGKYPEAPVKRVDLVYRRWDHKSLFSTIELYGVPRIVKCIPGGAVASFAGGAPFRLWEGPAKGFSRLPIAFPDKGPMGAVTGMRKAPATPRPGVPSTDPPRKKILRASKPLRASDSGLIYNWTNPNDDDVMPQVHSRQASFRKASVKSPYYGEASEFDYNGEIGKEFAEDSSSEEASSSSETSDSSNDGPIMTPKSSPRQNIKAEPHSLSTPFPSVPRAVPSPDQKTSGPPKDSTLRPTASLLTAAEIDNTLIQLRKEGKTWKEVRDHIDNITGQTSGVSTWACRYARIKPKNASGGRKTRRSKPKTAAKGLRKRLRNEPGDESEEDDIPISKKSIRREIPVSPKVRPHKVQAAKEHSCSRRDYLASQGPTTNRRPSLRFRAVDSRYPPTSTLHFGEVDMATPETSTVPDTSSEPTLVPHKLSRTSLRIFHSGSFTPLKLRSYPTISKLFTAVLSICGMVDYKDNVDALRATLTWLPDDDPNRTMLLNKDFEDSFEFLLDTIDEAPCWDNENGKCTVNIEVVHRNIEGEPLQNTWVGKWPASDVH